MERNSHFTDLAGPVHYVQHPGGGPPLVMLHGLGASHLNWDRMAARLSGGRGAYALDLRGFGLTPLAGHRADLATQVALVADFIEQVVGEPAIVVGNSMGGTIAMMVAEQHPRLVEGLVLFAPGLPPQSTKGINTDNLRFLGFPLLPGLGEAALRRYRETNTAEERTAYLWETMTARPERIDEATRAAFIEMRRLRDDMEWADIAYCQALRSTTALLLNRGRFRRMIHRIAAPTLIIHGMEDVTVPYDTAQWLAAERPDWQFSPLADAGHVPHIELPERAAQILEEWVATIDPAVVR